MSIDINACIKCTSNRFNLILIAAQRCKELNNGAMPKIHNDQKDKDIMTALEEISLGLLDVTTLEKIIANKNFIVKENIN